MQKQEIGEELVAVDLEVHLSANEREAWSELAEGIRDADDYALFQLKLTGVAVDREEIQRARITSDLLSEVRFDRRESTGIIARCCSFSLVQWVLIPGLASSDPRAALPIAGDDVEVKARASKLLSTLGFDAVDAGTLAESWWFEPESAVYTALYAAAVDAAADGSRTPATSDRVRALLTSSSRVDVGARQF